MDHLLSMEFTIRKKPYENFGAWQASTTCKSSYVEATFDYILLSFERSFRFLKILFFEN